MTYYQFPCRPVKLFSRMVDAVEFRALLRTNDTEFLHFGLEGGAFDTQASGGSGGAPNDPLRFLQGAQDMVAFGFFEGRHGRAR